MDDRLQKASQFFQKTITGNDLVKGAGTGTSDSVPAVITSREGKPMAPAALSVGEFVVKADTVSKLGGGATDPGVAFLTALTELVDSMDRFTASSFSEIVIDLGQRMISQDTPSEEEMKGEESGS